jgi:hypothetical protein
LHIKNFIIHVTDYLTDLSTKLLVFRHFMRTQFSFRKCSYHLNILLLSVSCNSVDAMRHQLNNFQMNAGGFFTLAW